MNNFFNLENAIDGLTLIVASWVIRANLQRSKAVKHTVFFYYIDTSVLLEITSLEKFIRNHMRDSSRLFSISSLVKISMISLHAGLFGAKAGTKSVTKNGATSESGTFEDWRRN